MKNKHTLIVGIGALLLWVIAYATIITGSPEIYAPCSFTIFVPILLLSSIFGNFSSLTLGTLTIPILFIAWSYPLIKGQKQIPKRSIVASLALIFLSAVFLLVAWEYGIEGQGLTHTITMYVFNFCFWCALLLIYRANTCHISFYTNFLFHWTMFAWFGWVAFPGLGPGFGEF